MGGAGHDSFHNSLVRNNINQAILIFRVCRDGIENEVTDNAEDELGAQLVAIIANPELLESIGVMNYQIIGWTASCMSSASWIVLVV